MASCRKITHSRHSADAHAGKAWSKKMEPYDDWEEGEKELEEQPEQGELVALFWEFMMWYSASITEHPQGQSVDGSANTSVMPSG
ncbi:hypothetical protein AAFF_G00110100 [Aldrovandia affinis]|uniref:Uncharacterized protein n=1 Tax=Aldrovandia affinis TaxID=143900 RepID=A0AAD7RTK4_9TELE|nr:hypothetical protein AAFF_G00110100 [Aldrovandia affinis]